MPLPTDPDKLSRQWHAGGGFRGAKPVRPQLPGEWRPGMPSHWQEETRFSRIKFILVRIFGFLQMAAGVAYLQFRVRTTIGVFQSSRHPAMLVYQYFFFAIELFTILCLLFRQLEAFRVTRRNCVNFKQIPNDLIAPYFTHSSKAKVKPDHSNCPSVAVLIPCYNEDTDLVLETVLGALHIDYPKELLTVYLCDDGQNNEKRSMVSQLRKQYKNVHYVIRPDNSHAKAGNLNYSLRRTTSDLVVTLDADFVARPNLLQRLLPYYFVWNSALGMYEFNETLAVVQTPQYFRNLSPYDSDPLDQRSTFFFNLILPGKDWWNASTMIGTTNLLSRNALQDAEYYPYYSITEDSAMSLKFHSLGFRTYFVNESLATGLATTSLWANLRQRARWLKGDWQILFSRNGPLCAKGLSLAQRLLYFHMTVARFISIVHLLYDVCAVVLLVGGIPPLDTPDPVWFLVYIGIFLVISIIVRLVMTSGGQGLEKSESGSVMFETIFRYTIVKGLFIALFNGENLQFKVTEKASVDFKTKKPCSESTAISEKTEEQTEEMFDSRGTVLGRGSHSQSTRGLGRSSDARSDDHGTTTTGTSDRQSSSSATHEDDTSITISEDDDGRAFKKRAKTRSPEEKAERRRDTLKNLKRIWFNVFFAILLGFAITWAIINPPSVTETDGEIIQTADGPRRQVYNNIIPLAMALGFALANLLPHILAIYLCFIPYVSGWVQTDLVHGRCDQYAVNPKNGKLFVPWSFISLLTVARYALIFGSMAALGAFSFALNKPSLVPV